jgi:hypothetical protein
MEYLRDYLPTMPDRIAREAASHDGEYGGVQA